MDERMLGLYEEELRHLRETTAEFAREFPKIAARLALDQDASNACPDPYVERLLEGFAFMAARVRLKLDSGFPQFTQGLMEAVYPDYLCPVPSMCVVQFLPEATEGALASGVVVPRKTVLRGPLGKRENTRATFLTAHPVTLTPFEVQRVQYHGRDVGTLGLPPEVGARGAIAIRLHKTAAVPFAETAISSLVFHIHGDGELPVELYELVMARSLAVVVQNPGTKEVLGRIGFDKIRRVGFSREEALLPPSPRGFEGYRLLKEYFAMPERFLFFELTGLKEILQKAKGDDVQLVIALDERNPAFEDAVETEMFRLHCTPAVNLFEKQLDRVPVGQETSEFHIVPDRNRPLDFEVYRITSVTGIGETAEDEQIFQSFHTARDQDDETATAYYTTSRVPRHLTTGERVSRQRPMYGGSDLFISLVDSHRAPFRPEIRQLAIRALCSNRHLPLMIPIGGGAEFTTESAACVVGIRTISGPTPPRASPVEGTIAWRLIDHLSLNYFSIADEKSDEGARAFRELLLLYADPLNKVALKQIEGIRHIRSKPVLQRVQTPGPIAFARGIQIEVQVDESAFVGTGAFLLGSVLEEFFARHVAINSFTETVLTSVQRKEIMRWPARTGARQLI